jgi:hypothetical protein
MKISQALRPMDAIEDGVWVEPVREAPEFRVKARIRGAKYHQRMQLRQAEWGRIYGARGAPQEIIQSATAAILFEECIVAFEGLEPCDEFPDVSMEAVKRYCGSFQGQPLYFHFLTAVEMVDGRRAADTEEAAGNSEPSSNGS